MKTTNELYNRSLLRQLEETADVYKDVKLPKPKQKREVKLSIHERKPNPEDYVEKYSDGTQLLKIKSYIRATAKYVDDFEKETGMSYSEYTEQKSKKPLK